MNKKWMLTGLLAAAATLPSEQLLAQKKPQQKKPMQTSPPKVVTKGNKGIDLANFDLTVKPGDNFYLYANGNWLKKNAIPASRTSWGTMDIIRLNNLERMRELCENARNNMSENSLNQRVGALYASAMDTVAIEALGAQPIKNDFDRLGKLTDKKDILTEVVTLRALGKGSPFFGFGVGQDDKDVNKYIVRFSQSGTSLPDRDYYLKNDPRSIKIRDAYQSYIQDILKLCGDDSAKAAAKMQSIMRIESALAAAQMNRTEMRDPNKTYNKLSVAAFSKLTPSFNWAVLLPIMKVRNVDSVLINNPAFFKSMDSLYSKTPVTDLAAYVQWNFIKGKVGYLSSNFVKRSFQFTQVLSGQKEMTPRWQTMSGLVDGNLGDLLGQLYVAKYFTQDAKNRMQDLVMNVQQAFRERIERLPWMQQVTKDKAMEKLNTIVNKIGYPDKWETYEGVVIKSDDLLGNIYRINDWGYNDNVSRLGKPVDKMEWGMTPPTVNAYYRASNNEIVFPAGILQYPFFDNTLDDAVNYGAIAAVIGHELTHGFDDKGRLYGADGNLSNWWQEGDEIKFNHLADGVIKQFDAFTVNDSIHVNGKLTLGENLADLGGLNIAYQAFKKTTQGQGNTKIDGFTPDQRFFLAWAQVWRKNTLPETSAQLILTDPHSPSVYRVNGPLSNMTEWYNAFGIKPTDKLYKPEAERIVIW